MENINYNHYGLALLVGAVLALVVYITMFQPSPPEPGMDTDAIEQLEKEIEQRDDQIVLLQEKLDKAHSNSNFYKANYNRLSSQLNTLIAEIDGPLKGKDLSGMTFEEKIQLFNKLTEN